MSDSEIIERDEKTGRFLIGHKAAGPGRPRGARSKLGEAFLEDLRDAWNEHGADALVRCAKEEPGQFCRIVASLMPKDVNLNLSLDPATFADRFQSAYALLGNPEPPMTVIKPRVAGKKVAADRGG